MFERAEDLYRSDIRSYGRHGADVHDALCEAFNALEGGAGTSLASSGHGARAADLEGFWEVIMMQVDEVKGMFTKLDKLRANAGTNSTLYN